MTEESYQCVLEVHSLGAGGDGLIPMEGKNYYLPMTLPGEKLHLRFKNDHVELIERQSDSSLRVTPPCSLFEECGGCHMQHLSPHALLEWKKERVSHALTQAGFQTFPEPDMFQTAPQTRRRMDFALQRIPGGMLIGLHRRQGDPLDLTECAILHPKIADLLPALRLVLSSLGALTDKGGLLINLFDSGPDLTLETEKELSASDRKKLADFAKEYAIPRITWRRSPTSFIENIVQWGPVFHHFSDVKITPPPASFLQASNDSEAAILEEILKSLPKLNKKDRIIELYAGSGTFSFALAEKAHITAYEGNHLASQALHAASHQRRITAISRDLARQPLLPQELKNARVIVLDPPYQGAGKQMNHIANSEVKDVIYVSCNPAALIKDISLLQKAGFQLLNWRLIDQFLWSTEIETVLNLSRDPKRIKKAFKNS